MKGLLRRFTFRLVAGMLLVHAMLIPVLFAAVVLEARRNYVDSFVDRARADAWLLAATVGALPLPAADLLLDDAILTGRISGAALLDAQGRTLLVVGSVPSPFQEDFLYGQGGDGRYLIETELPNRALRLRLAYDERPTAARIARAWQRALGLAAGYLLLTLALASFLGWRLARPLHRIRALSRSIAEGRVNTHLVVPSELYEVSELAEDLERMRARLVEQRAQLEHLALHDPLTGLANRALLEDRLRAAVVKARRERQPFALLLLDLDRFKEINDTLGHEAGDALLREVAARLRRSLRETDTAARLGGDEFSVILPGVAAAAAQRVAAKLAAALNRPYRVRTAQLEVGASIGIALCPDHGLDAGELLRCADIAMYAAKRSGRDHALYHSTHDTYDPLRLTLVSDLRAAIAEKAIRVHYQPQVDPRTGAVIGVEALARWRHPRQGEVPPDVFIPAAERGGMITSLTLLVLRQALGDLAGWLEQGHRLRLAVNLSPFSLHEADCIHRLTGLIRQHRPPPGSLVLELIESAVLADLARAEEAFAALGRLGVGFSVDDFGSGYSFLRYLRRLPVDEIKLERSYIAELRLDPDARALVGGVAELAHGLGLRLVAEGIEDAETLRIVAELGCDLAQGFHIARPMPSDALSRWLATRGAKG